MTKVLFILTILTIMTLTACSQPAQTEESAPTATPRPVATEPGSPAAEPATATTQPPETPTAAPAPTALTAPTAIPSPEPSAAATPSPTATATPTVAPTPTDQPPPTPEPTPAATPIPEPTVPPTATAKPTSTPVPTPGTNSETWRGITVAAEDQCSPYDSDEYPYSPSVEPRIVEELGGIYGPYTGTWFETIRDTDIEHIVARSEAHDSGLCAATPATKAQFASDLLNLTLASPSVNRHQKVAKDAAEWLPDLNSCWYVDRVVQVRLEYGLTIDQAEAEAIDQVLAECDSTEMVMLNQGVTVTATTTPRPTATPAPAGGADALALYDDNGNGRITCAEARAHGIAPVRRGHPAYQYMRDADGDGVVCE